MSSSSNLFLEQNKRQTMITVKFTCAGEREDGESVNLLESQPISVSAEFSYITDILEKKIEMIKAVSKHHKIEIQLTGKHAGARVNETFDSVEAYLAFLDRASLMKKMASTGERSSPSL